MSKTHQRVCFRHVNRLQELTVKGSSMGTGLEMSVNQGPGYLHVSRALGKNHHRFRPSTEEHRGNAEERSQGQLLHSWAGRSPWLSPGLITLHTSSHGLAARLLTINGAGPESPTCRRPGFLEIFPWVLPDNEIMALDKTLSFQKHFYPNG